MLASKNGGDNSRQPPHRLVGGVYEMPGPLEGSSGEGHGSEVDGYYGVTSFLLSLQWQVTADPYY